VGCAVLSSGADTATVSLAAGDLGAIVVHAEIKTTLTTRTKVFGTRFLTVHSPPLEMDDLSWFTCDSLASGWATSGSPTGHMLSSSIPRHSRRHIGQLGNSDIGQVGDLQGQISLEVDSRRMTQLN
jgi:hypothetical protein